MAGKTIVITGGNAGLGYQCAKQVATAGPGYQVVLACRSAARGETAAETLRTETGNPNITSMELDLASLVSDQTDRHITVNAFNPGAMTDTRFATPSGNALARGATRAIGGVMGKLIGKQSTSAKSGADLAALVTDPAYNNMTGKYFDRGVETRSSALSHDLGNARELWETSAKLCGLNRTLLS